MPQNETRSLGAGCDLTRTLVYQKPVREDKSAPALHPAATNECLTRIYLHNVVDRQLSVASIRRVPNW